jgi:outer membrane receptor protein involved in Fe transport
MITPWSGATLKAVYTEAFRAPTAYERYYADPRSRLSAPNLAPEVVRSVEGSFEQRFGAQRILFGAFRSFYLDMVLLSPATPGEIAAGLSTGEVVGDPAPTGIYRYRNVPDIESWGFQAAFDGALASGRLRYGAQLTGAYTRRDVGSSSLPLTVGPQLFGNARVMYNLPGKLPSIALAAQFLGERPADRAFDGGFSPAPFAPPHLELRAAVAGRFPWVSGLSYRLTADVAFAERGPYVIGPVQYATPEQPTAELSPVDRFRVGLGLWYDL